MIHRRDKGYTLVEVMMTVMIFVMIMGGLYAGLIAAGRSWQAYDTKALTQREARRAFVTLNRDLRMARDLLFKKNKPQAVVFSFRHPDQGTVTYAWTRTGDRRAAALTRTHADNAWVISRHISDFEVKEDEDGIRFSITAAAPEPKGSPQSFRLDGQVMKR